MSPDVGKLLEDPAYFPHRFDPASGRFLFVHTDHDRLTGAAFLDGRAPFTIDSSSYVVDADVLLRKWEDRAAVPEAPRIIYHTAFCGSTLLARSLDVPGHSLCLREPQVLVDFANWKLRIGERERARYDRLAALVVGLLSRRWQPGEMVVLKPSNWINSSLSRLTPSASSARALFMDIEARAFVVAIFRGGTERIRFILDFLNQMERAYPAAGPSIRLALASPRPLQRVARLATLALQLQRQAFSGMRERMDRRATTRRRLRYEELVSDPADAVGQAASALELVLSPDDIREAIARSFGTHSKAQVAFEADAKRQADDQVRHLYGAEIDDALRWTRETMLGHHARKAA